MNQRCFFERTAIDHFHKPPFVAVDVHSVRIHLDMITNVITSPVFAIDDKVYKLISGIKGQPYIFADFGCKRVSDKALVDGICYQRPTLCVGISVCSVGLSQQLCF